jgi:hypothetical protein
MCTSFNQATKMATPIVIKKFYAALLKFFFKQKTLGGVL